MQAYSIGSRNTLTAEDGIGLPGATLWGTSKRAGRLARIRRESDTGGRHAGHKAPEQSGGQSGEGKGRGPSHLIHEEGPRRFPGTVIPATASCETKTGRGQTTFPAIKWQQSRAVAEYSRRIAPRVIARDLAVTVRRLAVTFRALFRGRRAGRDSGPAGRMLLDLLWCRCVCVRGADTAADGCREPGSATSWTFGTDAGAVPGSTGGRPPPGEARLSALSRPGRGDG